MVQYNNKWIHFGDTRYEQYEDKIGLYSHLNHFDKRRRANYLSRAKGIKNKKGERTYLDKSSPNYYSVKYLW
jgi:hypothetical protein